MPVHPAYVERFAMLEGIESLDQLMVDPVLEERFHEFMQWRDAAPPPDADTDDLTVPGPHGPVPVRVYRPSADDGARPCLVWMHGGALMMVIWTCRRRTAPPARSAPEPGQSW